MSDTWAGILAISVAVMAVVQVVYLVVFAMAAKRLMAVVENTQEQVEALAADVKLRVGAVTDRVNAVAEDVRSVTSRVQHVATTVSDGVQRVEQTVRNAGTRVATTINEVPGPVKKGVPAGLAILAAIKTVQQVRSRMKQHRAERAYKDSDMYAAT